MQANPDKFQAVVVGVKSFEQVKHFTLAGVDIPCEENVKLLGVELDFMLNSDKQIKKHVHESGSAAKCFTEAQQIPVCRNKTFNFQIFYPVKF